MQVGQLDFQETSADEACSALGTIASQNYITKLVQLAAAVVPTFEDIAVDIGQGGRTVAPLEFEHRRCFVVDHPVLDATYSILPDRFGFPLRLFCGKSHNSSLNTRG